jgi:hypothetical protein
MWKYLSRGLRETLERRINFRKKDKAARQECHAGAFQNKLIPETGSSNKYDNEASDLGGGCKNGPCNDKKRQNRKQHGEKWNCNRFLEDPLLLGALGWSGIVLGWYLGQPLCHRHRHHHHVQPSERKSQTQLSHCHTEYVSLFRILSYIAFAQPLSILPKRGDEYVPWSLSLPSSSSNPDALQLQSSSTISLDATDSPEASVSETKFGPITAEEALDEAAHNLTKVQNRVMSDIENRLGVACMQLRKYKEAHTYFQRAVQLGCPPAAFNLGLCYESGIGTPQDFKLAAKYYKLASKWGHATAMYNLGVFYVHGWGGVPVDCNRARELFVAAAEMGQVNAQEALAMVPPANGTDSTGHVSTELREPAAASCEPQQTNILYQMLGILKSRQPVADRPEMLQNMQQGKPSATKILYQVLGSKEPDVLRNKASKVAYEDNKNAVNLHNELNTSSNVPTECKNVPHFSVIC